MAKLKLTSTTTVGKLKTEFHKAFGARLRVYNQKNVANDSDTLSSVGLIKDETFECGSNRTVASFIDAMADFGLTVKVYTHDEFVAVLDGLTLYSAGQVKKYAKK
ncbi:MAG: hypothetical protein ACI30M_07165 [Muribaculaceae bacterium]